MMCPSAHRPVVSTVGALGLGTGDKPGYQGTAVGGGLYFIYLPQSKAPQASPKAKWVDTKDPAAHAAWAVEEIRVFFSWFPRSRRAEGIKWWAAGVRQLICLLMAARLSAIAVDSGLVHGREALPHRDGDYFQRGARRIRGGFPKETLRKKARHTNCLLRFVFWLFHLLFVQSTNAFVFLAWRLVQLLRKGKAFQLWRDEESRGKTGWGGRGELIRKSANSTEMAVVIQLSPWAVKILVLSLGVYLFFLCQNCPPCTQVD